MSNNKPDKYLTDMKELPPSNPAEKENDIKEKEEKESAVAESTEVKEEVVKKDVVKANKKDGVEPLPEKNAVAKSFVKPKSDTLRKESEKISVETADEQTKEGRYTYKDIILGVVNLISIIFFVVIIVNFPKKSQELKNLRIEEIKNQIAANLETNEIEMVRPKAEAINKLFLDEAGIVNFVNDVELQKSEGGAISKVSFASQKAVADRTGNYGVPIVIELKGSWEAIDLDLQKIDKLPYLFRPVKVEIGYDEENIEMVVYKYGIFLYVRESLGKTR